MLNVERLMASELVALSSHEVVAAALFLWCRAWKQTPAASLPDDDRVNAAFSRIPLTRFRKLKDQILRGFTKCSDGRLYHRVLADEAMNAFAKKEAFKKKRVADAERLRNWRKNKDETHDETHTETGSETPNETRFVAEGQGQGQGHKERKKEEDTPSASPGRPSSQYAFAGAVIRLTPADFAKWRNAYSAIPDLTAELTALDDWISGEPEADRKRWFHVVSGALKKRHQAATEAAKPKAKKVVGLDF